MEPLWWAVVVAIVVGVLSGCSGLVRFGEVRARDRSGDRSGPTSRS